MKYKGPILRLVLALLILQGAFSLFGALKVRIKDISTIRGIRENQLIGYGLVVGLNGRGDSPRSGLTKETIRTFLKKIGINVDQKAVLSANSAVVIVTATIKPFSHAGERVDVTVSSLADARSLAGGVLLQTPLKAADGKIYAVAQGQVLVGGTRKTTLTVGRVPLGALVERPVGATFLRNNRIAIALNDRDFTTMNNIAKALKEKYPKILLRIESPKMITVAVPTNFRANPIAFIAEIEKLEIEADTPARVVVDGKSGTVVMGENVKISRVAVSYNGIKISIGFTGGSSGSSFMLGGGANVKNLVDGLNRIGARASDIINILQAIDKAGALKARLIIM